MSKIIDIGHISHAQVPILHSCSHCKSIFSWGKESFWYGTLDAVSFKACSISCKKELMYKKRLGKKEMD